MRRIVECDVDGVLLDIYKPIEDTLKLMGYNINFERDCTTWSMESLGELRPLVLSALKDPFTRQNAVWYPYARKLLKALYSYAQENNFVLVLNTHEVDADCAYIKFNQCADLVRELNMTDGVEINVQTGKSKFMLNSRICIEDSLPNLRSSSAYLKFLVPHLHNNPKTNSISTDIIRVEPTNLINIFNGGCHSEPRGSLQIIRSAI